MVKGLKYSRVEKSNFIDCGKPWNTSSGVCGTRGGGRTCTLATPTLARWGTESGLSVGALITSGIKAGYETITEEARQTYFNETDYMMIESRQSINNGVTIYYSYDREIKLPTPMFEGKPLNYRIESAYNRDAFLIQWFQKHLEPAVDGDDLGCPISPLFKIEWTQAPTLPPSEPTGDNEADADADADNEADNEADADTVSSSTAPVVVTVDEDPEVGTVTRTVRPVIASMPGSDDQEKKKTVIPFYKNWKIMVPIIIMLIIILMVVIMVMKKKPKPLQVTQWGRRY